jgi:hypothetical protein
VRLVGLGVHVHGRVLGSLSGQHTRTPSVL